MTAPSAVPKPPPTPATPPAAAAKEAPKKPVVPELSRSREAKDRISKIMKGVSLRPIRRPGTMRQWSAVGLVVLAVLVSYLFPRTWVAAGPVSEKHAPIEAKCETCHSSQSTFHLMSVSGSSTQAMNASCVTACAERDVGLAESPSVYSASPAARSASARSVNPSMRRTRPSRNV